MGPRTDRSAQELLLELHQRGAHRLRRVVYRRNRSTIWSLTQNGTVLNVHEAFRSAPLELVEAFAVIAAHGGLSSPEAEAAGAAIYAWPELMPAIEALRAEHEDRSRAIDDDSSSPTHCCATPEQRAYLRALYSYFNQTRFGGSLPADVPIRLSSRMRSALGHMLPGARSGERYVVEIALNVDLMLQGNGAERVDTLLHEMAHVADYLENGERGHGRSWKELALRIGCTPATLYERPVRRRGRRDDPVTRVPPLPSALLRRIA